VHHRLAAQQVQALNAVSALVDGVEAVVAVVLLDVVLPRVAVSAVHLDGEAVGLQAPLGGPALGEWGQHVQQQSGAGALLLGGGGALLVHQPRAVQEQSERPFHVRLLRQQHPAYVRVLDDGHLRGRGILPARAERAALGAFACVAQRLEVSGVAERHRARSDADPRTVHHVEHVREAPVRLTHQVTHRPGLAAGPVAGALAEVEQRVGGAPVPHLVVEPCGHHVVALTEAAVRGHEVLGDDEQREPLDPGRPAGDAGEHEMDDVLRQLVIAPGDPHLGTEEPVCAVRPLLGTGRHIGERGARLRFGQAHRPEEPPLQHRPHIGVDLLARAVRAQQARVAESEERIRGRAHVGSLEVAEAGGRHGLRHAQAAELLVHGRSQQP
jgi:hypothetical protein